MITKNITNNFIFLSHGGKSIHTLILEQVREYCEKGKGRLSVHFPEMEEIYSSVAENIMSRDLEISAEMDTEPLRGWVEERKENPNLLKSLIRESAAFFHNRAGNNGWHRSLSHARRCISGTGSTGQALRE